MSRSRGRRMERKLWRELDGAGFACVKGPSSGSGRKDDQPDLVAADSRLDMPPLAIEAKSTDQEAYTVYRSDDSEKDEVNALERWAQRFGAVPVIAVYWVGDEPGVDYGACWRFRETTEVRATRAGNLRPRRENRDGWVQIEDLADGRLL